MGFDDISIKLLEKNRTLPEKEAVLVRFRDGLYARLEKSDVVEEEGSLADEGTTLENEEEPSTTGGEMESGDVAVPDEAVLEQEDENVEALETASEERSEEEIAPAGDGVGYADEVVEGEAEEEDDDGSESEVAGEDVLAEEEVEVGTDVDSTPEEGSPATDEGLAEHGSDVDADDAVDGVGEEVDESETTEDEGEADEESTTE